MSRTNRCRHINHCCNASRLRATHHSIAKVLSRSTTTEPVPSIEDSIWSRSRHCPLCTAARGRCLTLCPLSAKVKSRPFSVQVLQAPLAEFRNPMNGIAPWTHSKDRRPTWKHCTTRQARTRALTLSHKTNHSPQPQHQQQQAASSKPCGVIYPYPKFDSGTSKNTYLSYLKSRNCWAEMLPGNILEAAAEDKKD